MTELETLRRAKMYLDKLAQGIDPISGLEMPEDAVLNQVRLARCFFYVSGVLEKVIANGGQIGAVEKRDFEISQDQLSMVQISAQPISVSDLIGRLFAVCGAADMKKPSATQFTNWLADKGLLMTVARADGKRGRVPTELGRSMGILSETRQGRDGAYEAVLYAESAQRFLLDHLEEILHRQQEN